MGIDKYGEVPFPRFERGERGLGMGRKGVGLSVLLLVLGASPALALPRLTQGPGDYFLMPLLGYLALVAVPRFLVLTIGRLRGNRG